MHASCKFDFTGPAVYINIYQVEELQNPAKHLKVEDYLGADY